MKVYVLVCSISVAYYGVFATLYAAQESRETRMELEGRTMESYTILAVSI